MKGVTVHRTEVVAIIEEIRQVVLQVGAVPHIGVVGAVDRIAAAEVRIAAEVPQEEVEDSFI